MKVSMAVIIVVIIAFFSRLAFLGELTALPFSGLSSLCTPIGKVIKNIIHQIITKVRVTVAGFIYLAMLPLLSSFLDFMRFIHEVRSFISCQPSKLPT